MKFSALPYTDNYNAIYFSKKHDNFHAGRSVFEQSIKKWCKAAKTYSSRPHFPLQIHTAACKESWDVSTQLASQPNECLLKLIQTAWHFHDLDSPTDP